jgi:dTDP-4-amino-4,6-dideoxygalactose transaminase
MFVEKLFSDITKAKYCLTTNSCTSALMLSMVGYKELNSFTAHQNEVIVPSMTWFASANSIITAGLKPVFCDIDQESYNIDTNCIYDLLSQSTCGILPVNFAGQSCNIETINKIAKNNNLFVIEDSAEMLGAYRNSKHPGSKNTACFSFFPNKIITCGEGGMLTTNNKKLYLKAKSLSSHGMKVPTIKQMNQKKFWEKKCVEYGFNFRMSNIAAAMLVPQILELDSIVKKRQILAQQYNDLLLDIEWLQIPKVSLGNTHCYQMYCPIIAEKKISRNKLLKYLRSKNIQCGVHFYPPLHKQKIYKNFLKKRQTLPITEYVSNNIISLPMFTNMSSQEIDRIYENIKRFTK